MAIDGTVLRAMRTEDVPAVMAVQEPASVAGLSAVFPQDTHPFPRGVLAGFAALRGDELLHFGVAVEEWGSGLAVAAHDELLDRLGARGVVRPWLRVYAANPRGRAFWEKLGWVDTGERSQGPVPPHAELRTYLKQIDRNPA